jgi:DNA-binding MarR family transcriptional regulator
MNNHTEPELSPADKTIITPLLALVARSVGSTLDVVALEHLRILMLLSQRGEISSAELSRITLLPTRKLAKTLDLMQSRDWITTSRPARGIGETVSISLAGGALAEQVTRRRQDEIADILGRMSSDDRATVARAFSSFALAAAEPALHPPRKGLKP